MESRGRSSVASRSIEEVDRLGRTFRAVRRAVSIGQDTTRGSLAANVFLEGRIESEAREPSWRQ